MLLKKVIIKREIYCNLTKIPLIDESRARAYTLNRGGKCCVISFNVLFFVKLEKAIRTKSSHKFNIFKRDYFLDSGVFDKC